MVLLVALTLGMAPVAQAPASPREPSTIRATHIDVAVSSLAPLATRETGPLILRLEIRPHPGRYLYAPNQPGYVGFTLTFGPASGIKAKRLVLPAPEPYLFEPTGERLLVYSRPFTIEQHVELEAGARRPLTATLRYQACDAEVCYRPEVVAVTWMERGDNAR